MPSVRRGLNLWWWLMWPEILAKCWKKWRKEAVGLAEKHGLPPNFILSTNGYNESFFTFSIYHFYVPEAQFMVV